MHEAFIQEELKRKLRNLTAQRDLVRDRAINELRRCNSTASALRIKQCADELYQLEMRIQRTKRGELW